MRCILAVAAAFWLAAAPMAVAQDADQRLALSQRFIELSVGDGLAKMVQGLIEDEVAEQADWPEDQRDWVRTNAPRILTRHLEQFMVDLAPLYAEHLTEAELRALIDFYDTPMGHAIAAKQLEIGIAQTDQTSAFLQAFLTDYLAKYCAEFDCEAAGAGATPGKHGL